MKWHKGNEWTARHLKKGKPKLKNNVYFRIIQKGILGNCKTNVLKKTGILSALFEDYLIAESGVFLKNRKKEKATEKLRRKSSC